MIVKLIIAPAVLSGLLLSACATSQTPQGPSESTATPPAAAMENSHAMAGKMGNMQECKALMAKMHGKMKADGMDMAAMKAKMKSGEGMSDQQKKCHAMMHENMQARHDAMMQNMPPECKAMMAKMRDKMKADGMDMVAMKAKMKSGEGMSDQQKKCHAMMHENRHQQQPAPESSGP